MILVTDRYGNNYSIPDYLLDYFHELQYNWIDDHAKNQVKILEELNEYLI